MPENRILTTYAWLYAAQGRRCYLCSGRIRDKPAHNDGSATRDHVRPRSAGGAKRRNLLLAHSACNMRKGSRPPRPCELLYLDAINLILETPKRCRPPSPK